MNLRIISKILLLTAAAAGVIGLAVQASEKTEARPPLKLQLDAKPINREAADRVSYSAVVKKTAPSVVYVFSSKKVRAQDLSPFFNDPNFRRFFGAPGPGSGRQPEQTQTGLGSGIIVTADGYILTNNHVIDGADEVKVAFGEPRQEYKATIIGRDPQADVAVLKIGATGLSAATLSDSDKLEVGDVVLAIGNPFGLGQSVSRGIVSALSRGNLGIEAYEDFIQTDAAINPGNSGGALFDTDGRVIGLNTAILSRSGGFNGVGFAIPINQVRASVEQLVRTGKVTRGFLGVDMQPLDSDLTALFNVKEGALISNVRPDTPAEKAGLKGSDIITKVNGSPIKDNRELALAITRFPPGTEVKIEYVRDGKTATTTAKLGEQPARMFASTDDRGGAKDDGVLNGVTIDELTAEVRGQLNLPNRVEGVVITKVDPDSASARAGLREGDVISDLDRKPIRNVSEAVKLSEEIKGPKVLVRFWRNGVSRYLVGDESK